MSYGWITVIIGFFVLATDALAVFGFGVFLKPLTEQFGWERGTLSGAFAVGAILTGVSSLITGRLGDRYGPRIFATAAGILLGAGFLLMSRVNELWQVYLVWGLLVGVGIGCVSTPIISTIPRWFFKRRGIAIGITVAGFNFGAVIGPLLIQWLISTYDWQRAFLITGLIPIIVDIPLAQFLKRDPSQMGLRAHGEGTPIEASRTIDTAVPGLTFAQAVKTGRFWLFGFLQFSFGFCMQIVIIHIAPHANDIGIPAIIAASILSIIGGGRIIGNLAAGFFSEWLGNRRLLSVCFIALTLGLAWLIFTRSIIGFLIFAILFGVTGGGIIPLLTLVPAELFGLRSLGVVTGTFLLLGTIGGSLGSPLAGYIFDVSGDYRIAFAISVAVGVIAVILSLILLRHKGKLEYGKI